MIEIIKDAQQGKNVYILMSLEKIEYLFRYIEILYWRPKCDNSSVLKLDENSTQPPAGLESYSSGYNLITIKEEYEKWSKADQIAFEEFIDGPRAQSFFDKSVEVIKEYQQLLLQQPTTLPGILANWCESRRDPSQETVIEQDNRQPFGKNYFRSLDFFKSKKPLPWPEWYESLAAVAKLATARKHAPAFYRAHHDPLDMAEGFVGFLRGRHSVFNEIFMFSDAPLDAIAGMIRCTLPRLDLKRETVEFIDSTMTVIMRRLIAVVKDPNLPLYLKNSQWPILGGFES